MDFDLATLIATGEGTLFGAGLINYPKRIDKPIVGIARHRARSGGKARDSQRYRMLVTRVRGMLKTPINAALNQIVKLHAPAELAFERLDFRLAGLSRRMNRLVTNCGRAVFRAKLADLKDKFRITATEENAAYRSQECSLCHYVDAANRPVAVQVRRPLVRQCETRRCGRRTCHRPETFSGIGPQVAQHGDNPWRVGGSARQEISTAAGTAADPRLDNPYFAKWAKDSAAKARMLQA